MKEKRWKPEEDEKFWSFDGFGCVEEDVFCQTYDDKKLEFGNCFKTEEEAEAAAEKVKALLLSLQHYELPKLTAEVFDRPGCPAEADFAIVYPDGSASYMKGDPAKMKSSEMYWIYSVSSGIDKLSEIPGKFDASNWRCSLIEHPAKARPEWCKVGEWVYTCGGDYRKVEAILYGIVFLSGGLDIPVGDIHSELVKARFRPYNADEMKALVGKVVCTSEGKTFLVLSYSDNTVFFGDFSHTPEDLIFDIYKFPDGSPCGCLEHLENGEWVK